MGIIFALLGVLDLITTYIGGVHNEMNPIGILIVSQHGFMGLVVGKLLLIAYFEGMTAFFKRIRFPFLWLFQLILIGMGGSVVVWNVYCIVRNM